MKTIPIASSEVEETALAVLVHDEEETTLSLRVLAPRDKSQHPAAVYLAGLAIGSRRIVKSDLDTLARLLTSGRCDPLTLLTGRRCVINMRLRYGANSPVATLTPLATV